MYTWNLYDIDGGIYGVRFQLFGCIMTALWLYAKDTLRQARISARLFGVEGPLLNSTQDTSTTRWPHL
jgi:hypothetical protein